MRYKREQDETVAATKKLTFAVRIIALALMVLAASNGWQAYQEYKDRDALDRLINGPRNAEEELEDVFARHSNSAMLDNLYDAYQRECAKGKCP